VTGLWHWIGRVKGEEIETMGPFIVENPPEILYRLSIEDGRITSLNCSFKRITG
jgi:hypothetical protein